MNIYIFPIKNFVLGFFERVETYYIPDLSSIAHRISQYHS